MSGRLVIHRVNVQQCDELTRLVELEGFVTGIDSYGDGSDGGHGFHQSALTAAGNVDEARVVGCVKLGVILALLVVLKYRSR